MIDETFSVSNNHKLAIPLLKILLAVTILCFLMLIYFVFTQWSKLLQNTNQISALILLLLIILVVTAGLYVTLKLLEQKIKSKIFTNDGILYFEAEDKKQQTIPLANLHTITENSHVRMAYTKNMMPIRSTGYSLVFNIANSESIIIPEFNWDDTRLLSALKAIKSSYPKVQIKTHLYTSE